MRSRALAGQPDAHEEGPVFGRRIEGVSYLSRPSAYALIRDAEGLLAIVRTSAGFFLPGGGIESGETPELAVRREALEECGLRIGMLAPLARAVQLVHSASEETGFEKTSSFFEAVADGGPAGATEEGHEILWLPVEAAAAILSHESHRWAVHRLDGTPSAPD